MTFARILGRMLNEVQLRRGKENVIATILQLLNVAGDSSDSQESVPVNPLLGKLFVNDSNNVQTTVEKNNYDDFDRYLDRKQYEVIIQDQETAPSLQSLNNVLNNVKKV